MKPYKRERGMGYLCQLTFLFLLVTSLSMRAPADGGTVSPTDAIRFVGQSATVCGLVISAKFASESKGQPTFLNLDKPYPDHVFTAVVWGDSRGAFPYAPESLATHQICVTGLVKLYRGKAEIEVSPPGQVRTLSH